MCKTSENLLQSDLNKNSEYPWASNYGNFVNEIGQNPDRVIDNLPIQGNERKTCFDAKAFSTKSSSILTLWKFRDSAERASLISANTASFCPTHVNGWLLRAWKIRRNRHSTTRPCCQRKRDSWYCHIIVHHHLYSLWIHNNKITCIETETLKHRMGIKLYFSLFAKCFFISSKIVQFTAETNVLLVILGPSPSRNNAFK